MNWVELAPLCLVLILSLLGKSKMVAIAAALLLAMVVVGFKAPFPWLEKNLIKCGIFLLTLAVLIPLGTGKITLFNLYQTCTSLNGLIAIMVGIGVAWLGAQGVNYMQVSPDVISSLLIGTIIGVCFFGGIAVGPLIAAGVVYLMLKAIGVTG